MAENDEKDITIADLYPDLSPEEQAGAEYRLLGYLAIVRGIFERLEREGRLHEIRGAHLRKEWDKRSGNKKK